MTPTPHQPDLDLGPLRSAIETMRAATEQGPETPEGMAVMRELAKLGGLAALLDRLERAEAHLGNLLARIHRDGGHRAAEIGNEAAVKEADLIVAELIGRAEAAAGAVPEGFALVPLNPHVPQVAAGHRADPYAHHVTDIYTTMIAAAPPAQGLPAAPDDPDDDPAFCAWIKDYRITESQKWLAWGAWCAAKYSAPPVAAPSEPVAWGITEGNRGVIFTSQHKSACENWLEYGAERKIIPLFATPPAQDAGTGDAIAALVEAEAALAGGLWDYGPGQDEHERCNEVLERIRPVIAANSGRTE